MGSTHDSRYWTCPHCFAVVDWEVKGAVEKHSCKAIKELTSGAKKPTARLEDMINTLKNPKRKRHG